MTSAKKPLFAITLAMGLALVSGCAAIAPATPEAAVQKRAQERVKLLQAREFTKAYAYLTPAYRALNDADSYRHSFGGSAAWVDPKVGEVKCPDSSASHSARLRRQLSFWERPACLYFVSSRIN